MSIQAINVRNQFRGKVKAITSPACTATPMRACAYGRMPMGARWDAISTRR
jgi:hypothetical protein